MTDEGSTKSGPAVVAKGSVPHLASEQMKLRNLWIAPLLGVWWLTSILGVLASRIDIREAFATTSEGRTIGYCGDINPRAVENAPDVAYQYCTSTEVIGPSYPDDVQWVSGSRIFPPTRDAAIDVVWNAMATYDLWFALGIGTAAIIAFFVLSTATGTLRAGLAAALTFVFLGIVLFPSEFTARIPADVRTELITSFRWIILFYFGSEAAVQAWKVAKPEGANVTGDISAATETTAPTPGPG
ncbi:hypothetical protein [Rhodococcoides fascians]|uniref:hypothetical protein n=1 Tax=Rhodococcoides fascians TaxID=1828 RepID=UPI00117AA110|nr:MULTISPECIES: hypothetical protein [Rhodococcus]